MSTGLPCPNPTCSHVFAAPLPAGGALQCPACGHTFTFHVRPTAPAAEPKPVPLAMPVAPPTSAPPLAQPVAKEVDAADLDFAAPIEARRSRTPRKKLPRWALFLVLAVAVGGIAYAIRTGLWHDLRSELSAVVGNPGLAEGPGLFFPELNCRFTYPGPEWHTDEALRSATRANALAMARGNPDAWLALGGKDYKTVSPDIGQVMDDALSKLRAYFKNLEYDVKEEVDFAGRKATRVVFQGSLSDALVSGECYLLAHRGIGYWLAVWTTGQEAQQHGEQIVAEFIKVRRGFALAHERADWQETIVTKTFKGTKADYEFQKVAALWKTWPTPADADSAADLYLIGDDPDAGQDIKRRATAMVLLLDKKGALAQATAAARSYLEAQRKKLGYKEVALEVIADKDGPYDRDAKIGTAAGHIVKLHIKEGETRERFLLLAVVPPPDGDQLLVVECECDWPRRPRWESVFQQLLDRLRFRGEMK